ncbi:MAG: ester cyclase [Chloroflexi bacterium]|nr:ester cyclase [Chloroflexota bacterium]
MADTNTAIVRRFFSDVVNRRDFAVAERIMTQDFVDHPPPPAGTPSGREGFKQFASMLVGAFPDLQITVEDLIEEGDKVAARVTVRGTHKGLFMGQIAATGKRFEMSGVDIFRIAGGKIVERWNYRDLLGLMQQLGAIPAPR